jgi:hypothetical protein
MLGTLHQNLVTNTFQQLHTSNISSPCMKLYSLTMITSAQHAVWLQHIRKWKLIWMPSNTSKKDFSSNQWQCLASHCRLILPLPSTWGVTEACNGVGSGVKSSSYLIQGTTCILSMFLNYTVSMGRLFSIKWDVKIIMCSLRRRQSLTSYQMVPVKYKPKALQLVQTIPDQEEISGSCSCHSYPTVGNRISPNHNQSLNRQNHYVSRLFLYLVKTWM